ncbi:TRAP transporter small permease [Oceaniglobus ichthyenteri]|uniref:TRAP transporter small permease n=1 Tax=Oceaniglobus ichthyenteri TaxID=2136177 RepID=UPI000D3A9CD2|nr:TRAP transporter small permease [Oceaniglobus ichthyenteri]
MSIWSEAAAVVPTLFSGDWWAITQALRTEGAWVVGTAFTLLGAFLVMTIYRLVPFIERHFERTVMVYTYLGIAAIICVEVVRRFVFSVQEPWSTTFPPVLFLVMTWFGCAYNIKLRTHLAFNEFRTNMPRPAQMFCLSLDAVLWLVFCIIVVVTGSRVTANAADNFQILEGTDNFMKWWFLITVPIAFLLMAARVMENWIEDWRNYRSGEIMIKQAVIGGDV